MRRPAYNAAALKRLFNLYNRRYFNGELPDYKIRLRRLPRGLNGTRVMGQHERSIREIWLNPSALTSRQKWRATLLHECCHILSRPGHGGTFFRQQMRCPEYAIANELGHDLATRKLFTRARRIPKRSSYYR